MARRSTPIDVRKAIVAKRDPPNPYDIGPPEPSARQERQSEDAWDSFYEEADAAYNKFLAALKAEGIDEQMAYDLEPGAQSLDDYDKDVSAFVSKIEEWLSENEDTIRAMEDGDSKVDAVDKALGEYMDAVSEAGSSLKSSMENDDYGYDTAEPEGKAKRQPLDEGGDHSWDDLVEALRECSDAIGEIGEDGSALDDAADAVENGEDGALDTAKDALNDAKTAVRDVASAMDPEQDLPELETAQQAVSDLSRAIKEAEASGDKSADTDPEGPTEITVTYEGGVLSTETSEAIADVVSEFDGEILDPSDTGLTVRVDGEVAEECASELENIIGVASAAIIGGGDKTKSAGSDLEAYRYDRDQAAKEAEDLGWADVAKNIRRDDYDAALDALDQVGGGEELRDTVEELQERFDNLAPVGTIEIDPDDDPEGDEATLDTEGKTVGQIIEALMDKYKQKCGEYDYAYPAWGPSEALEGEDCKDLVPVVSTFADTLEAVEDSLLVAAAAALQRGEDYDEPVELLTEIGMLAEQLRATQAEMLQIAQWQPDPLAGDTYKPKYYGWPNTLNRPIVVMERMIGALAGNKSYEQVVASLIALRDQMRGMVESGEDAALRPEMESAKMSPTKRLRIRGSLGLVSTAA